MPARRKRGAIAQQQSDELPSDDEISLFHRDRSKRLARSRTALDKRSRQRAAISDSEDTEQEDEGAYEQEELEEVIGLSHASVADSDDSDDSDSDSDDDNGSDGSAEEMGTDSDGEPAERHPTEGWGASKSNYYAGDGLSSDDEEEEDTGVSEEAEALRLQRQRAQNMDVSDFFDDSSTVAQVAPPTGAALSKGVGPSSGKHAARRRGAGSDSALLEDGAAIEALPPKDLSGMDRDEKLRILIRDAPELMELLHSFKESVTQIRTQLAPLAHQVEAGKLPTSNGSSFLETKFHLLLSYCTNIAFYMLLKVRGESVRDHPIIDTLVKLRLLIEKCAPIDAKLKYRIGKLIAAAANPAALDADRARTHKPRPDQLVGESDEEDPDTDKQGTRLYTAPKLSSSRYDDGGDAEKAARKSSARRARLLKSEVVQSMRAELSEAPTEIADERSVAGRGLRGEAAKAEEAAEERRQYEEDNFVRLTLSKKDKAKEKLRARAASGMLDDEFTDLGTEQFGELASLVTQEEEEAERASKRSEREERRRRTLARYLNEIEQKDRRKGGSSRTQSSSGDTDLPWDAPEPRKTKRSQPDYSVNESDEEDDAGAASEDEVYTAALTQRERKAQQKQRLRESAAEEQADARERLEGKHTDGSKRAASRDIIKNKGLTPHRNKVR
eukprot:COSAG01_NODE_415_length_17322_cov_14.785926_11_plen_670_part_00